MGPWARQAGGKGPETPSRTQLPRSPTWTSSRWPSGPAQPHRDSPIPQDPGTPTCPAPRGEGFREATVGDDRKADGPTGRLSGGERPPSSPSQKLLRRERETLPAHGSRHGTCRRAQWEPGRAAAAAAGSLGTQAAGSRAPGQTSRARRGASGPHPRPQPPAARTRPLRPGHSPDPAPRLGRGTGATALRAVVSSPPGGAESSLPLPPAQPGGQGRGGWGRRTSTAGSRSHCLSQHCLKGPDGDHSGCHTCPTQPLPPADSHGGDAEGGSTHLHTSPSKAATPPQWAAGRAQPPATAEQPSRTPAAGSGHEEGPTLPAPGLGCSSRRPGRTAPLPTVTAPGWWGHRVTRARSFGLDLGL